MTHPSTPNDQFWRLSPADVAGHERAEAGDGSSGRGINGDKALIADEATGLGVVDHDPEELQVAVGVIFYTVGKEAGGSLRINQLRPEVLNFAGKNLRGLDS